MQKLFDGLKKINTPEFSDQDILNVVLFYLIYYLKFTVEKIIADYLITINGCRHFGQKD